MSDKTKLLYMSAMIQIGFVLLAVIALAFAQSIDATLSLDTVLSTLGGCFVIELLVISIIWCYLHFRKGTLDDVSDGVRQAKNEVVKRARGIADTVIENGNASQAASSEHDSRGNSGIETEEQASE